jgi:predicted MFS family arabinose efflux permease
MNTRRTVRSLQLTVAALTSGYGVMFALLAKMRDRYGVSETMLGLIIAAGFFASFAAQIALAPLADRGRGRLLLLGGLTANIAGLVLVAASSEAPGFLGGRALMGIGVGAAYPAIRRAVAVAEPDQVGRNLGGILSFDVIGFLTGPAIAAVLAGPLGIRWPYLIAAGFSVVFLFVVWSVPMGEPSPGIGAPRLSLGLLRQRWMLSACCYGAAFFVMIGVFDALWALRITDLGGHDLYVTLGIIVFAAPLVFLGQRGGALVERTGPYRTGAFGLLVGAVCICSYGLIPVPALLVCVGVVHAVNDALTASSVPVAITLTAPPAQLAGAQGLVGAVQTLAGGLAASGAGAVYDRFGPIGTYAAAGTVMALAVVAGWALAGEHRAVRGGRSVAAPAVG